MHAFQMKCDEHFPRNLSEEIKASPVNSFRTINIRVLSAEKHILHKYTKYHTIPCLFHVLSLKLTHFYIHVVSYYCVTDINRVSAGLKTVLTCPSTNEGLKKI